jgi:1-hydroxycarotenoid 3,4-desaturase
LVIGAGVGGLTSAIDLARGGWDVTVVDRAPSPGGKMREVALGPWRIDSGPTVMTMRWVFDELFEAAGRRLDDYVVLEPLEILARHAWPDGGRLDLYADTERSADAIGGFAGAAEAEGYRRFCQEAEGVFTTLKRAFLTDQKTGPIGLSRRVGFARVRALMALRPFDTLWTALGDHFADQRLLQLFGRYATYCGSSPFAAPATLMLIAHVEKEGVWSVRGGMQRMGEALERLAVQLGVRCRYGAAAAEVVARNGRAVGVVLADGERLEADQVVVNADAAAMARGVLGSDVAGAVPAPPLSNRSLSAVTWSARLRAEGFPLVRHNVFFSADYRAEFDDIFSRGRVPEHPTVYVCAQDRTEGEETFEAGERLLILINAPARGDQTVTDQKELRQWETRVSDQLNRCGLAASLEPTNSVITTPQDFNTMFPGTGGALYGMATHGWAAAFQRPGASTRIGGLYLAGGGAHPGAGVPMAALSGRLAAQRLMRDHGSTSQWSRGATAGGMSTP